MIAALALSACFFLPQQQVPDRLKPLVPAPENFKPTPHPQPEANVPARRGQLQTGSFANTPAKPPQIALPFDHDRPLLKIAGIEITAQDLNTLVAYYRNYRQGPDSLLLADAVKALMPAKVLQSIFAQDLPAMKRKIEAARAAVQNGEDFASVVQTYSNDTEAPTKDGRYTFGREKAVQPFDRYSFETPVGTLSPIFLTVYGYHFLEVLAYAQGESRKDDKTTIRHVLVMYPRLVALENSGEDVRQWIKQQVNSAAIEVLEPGMENLIPPENRQQIQTN